MNQIEHMVDKKGAVLFDVDAKTPGFQMAIPISYGISAIIKTWNASSYFEIGQ